MTAPAMTTVAELQRDRQALWQRMQDIMGTARTAGRPMDEAESNTYEDLGRQIDSRATEIEQIETHERRERSLTEVRRDPRALPPSDGGDPEAAERSHQYRDVFNRYMRFGVGELNADERAMLRGGLRANPELRAAATQPGSAGGYLIPQGFSNKIVETLKWYGGMRAVADILSTQSGAEILYPTNDDSSNKGRRVADNTPATTTDLVFGQKRLNAYLYSSDIMLVPISLLQDEAVDLEAYITRKAAQRLGRIENQEQTLGTGAAQPNGIVTAAAVGRTTAATTVITYGELIDLEHSVDPAYRNAARLGNPFDPANVPAGEQGFVGYMFNDLILAALRKLADSQGRPLWVPQFATGVTQGVPATFNGWPYIVNNDMAATVVASAITALFGAFKNAYLIREVQEVTMLRLEERYADSFQVAFLAFHRMDSNMVDASAVKALQQHA